MKYWLIEALQRTMMRGALLKEWRSQSKCKCGAYHPDGIREGWGMRSLGQCRCPMVPDYQCVNCGK